MSVRDTSREAYRIINEKGLLSPRRTAIYNILYDKGPLTAHGVTQYLPLSKDVIRTQTNTHARLNEMKEMGCVREVGKETCPSSKISVYLFDVTSDLPRKHKRPKQETPKQKIARLEKENSFLKEKIKRLQDRLKSKGETDDRRDN